MNKPSSVAEHIVVVGNDHVAAGAAITLAHMLRPFATRVTWVRTLNTRQFSSTGIEVADPALGRWLKMVGLPESGLVQQCQGLYSLGTEYHLGSRHFFMPHGSHGIPPSPAPFEQEFFKRFNGAGQVAFNQHFLATHAAENGRFAFPVDDPRSARSTLKYGLHLDLHALTTTLADHARDLGVQCVDCDSLEIQGDSEGGIHALLLDNGERVEGDFFIDVTGPESKLLGETLNESFEPQTMPLWPYRVTYTEQPTSPWLPYAKHLRTPWGWCRRAGLQHKTVVDAWVCNEAALQTLEETLRSEDKEYVSWQVSYGARSNGWSRNCLALGAADSQAGELVLSQWYWASRCLLLWLELLPGRKSLEQPHLSREYNRRRTLLYRQLSELDWMHAYDVNSGENEAPENLQWRLQVFTKLGRLWRRDDEILGDENWLALALGLGWHAESHDLTLNDVEVAQLAQKHQSIYQTLAREAKNMPSLEAVLNNPARG